MSVRLIAGVKHARLVCMTREWVRHAGYWNRDWMPGSYPKNEDERRAAAKKYGLIPEDYKPYPDDGDGYGDYPNLPIISAESRDQHRNWDIDELKRDYGEPLHVDSDIYGEDRWDRSKRLRVPIHIQLLQFVGFMTIGSAILLIGEYLPKLNFLPRMPKHIAYDGKKHYTFELVESDSEC